MGQSRYRAEDFLRAIPGSMGIKSVIARRVGCSWKALEKALNRWPTVRAAFEAERENLVDMAELKIVEQVRDGDPAQVRFVLERLGRKRGWGREPAEGAADKAFKLTLKVVDRGRLEAEVVPELAPGDEDE